MKMTKIIDGKRFQFAGAHHLKSNALTEAKKLRNKGMFSARVIKGENKMWCVWVGTK
jgi:hypothetical protein